MSNVDLLITYGGTYTTAFEVGVTTCDVTTRILRNSLARVVGPQYGHIQDQAQGPSLEQGDNL